MNDIDRLRAEYRDRNQRFARSDNYNLFNAGYMFLVQQRQRIALKLLRQRGFYPLSDKRILEVGCGKGDVLLEYLTYGVPYRSLNGVDVLIDEVKLAHARLPHLPIVCADGQKLPYQDSAFDIVLQYMAFSSILDTAIRSNMACEMARVVKKSNGVIIWYDFWINPTNPQTRGISKAEIRTLFPEFDLVSRKITLAPPLARRLAPLSWILSSILEKLNVLNTHYLIFLVPKKS